MHRASTRKTMKFGFIRLSAELELAEALSFLTITTTLDVVSSVADVVAGFWVMTIVVAQGVANTVTVPEGHTGHTGTAVVAMGKTPHVGMMIGVQQATVVAHGNT